MEQSARAGGAGLPEGAALLDACVLRVEEPQEPTLLLPLPAEPTFRAGPAGLLLLAADVLRFLFSASAMQAPGWAGSGGRSLMGAGGGSKDSWTPERAGAGLCSGG